ncbi:uncharacterized protein LOC130264298 [Oenanthe melanoleuca]|uniref:uncharacterized protein LOC130264298 n=1 Tax=Oenanthe melanoleuca TaxID=2939378 RepID=UPI0024C20B38|nr:uncharacterized protein LOC130264298 [Oenanthe melanoleuca]
MSGACARELPPLDVARGCHRCRGLVRRGQEPLALQRSRSPAQEPGWPRRALSFLSEDGSGDSDSWVALGDIPEAGPLSSTRRSQLDGTGDSAVPWPCPQEPRGDSAVPWPCPQEPRGDSAVPLPPLASSTLLWDRDHPQEPPPSALGTRTGCRLPVPCPRVAPGVSLRRHQGGILGTRAMSPRSPLARGGCSVAPGSCGGTAGDIPGGWRGAVPNTGVTEPGRGDRAGFGDTGDSDSLGDSGDSFVSAREV